MKEEKDRPLYRHEYKYLCDSAQNAVLKMRAQGILQADRHAGESGKYTIRSLYLDSLEDSCYYENLGGVCVRDKYRIRIYDSDSRYIMLERKSKNAQMTRKVACRITEQVCRELMAGRAVQVTPEMPEVLKQLLTELRCRNMRPTVIVEYIRYPFVEKNGNVRITFDENISSSNELAGFLKEGILTRPILEKGKSILEVKWDAFLPDYIRAHMQMETLQRQSFSKYALCRKYNTYGGIRI